MLVVEHDEETIRRADYVIDLGPGAGRHGGELVAGGTPAKNRQHSPIADRRVHLRAQHALPCAPSAASRTAHAITILGARENNLKNLDVSFPAGRDDGGDRRLGLGQIDTGE